MYRLGMTIAFVAALFSVAPAANARAAMRPCHTGTLLEIQSRTDLVPTVSGQRVEKKEKRGKTVYETT